MTEMTAEQRLEHQRGLARERKRRFHDRHPGAGTEYGRRYAKAERVLRDRHRDEYLTLAAIARKDGVRSQQSFRVAIAELRTRYPDEWADILAAATS